MATKKKTTAASAAKIKKSEATTVEKKKAASASAPKTVAAAEAPAVKAAEKPAAKPAVKAVEKEDVKAAAPARKSAASAAKTTKTTAASAKTKSTAAGKTAVKKTTAKKAAPAKKTEPKTEVKAEPKTAVKETKAAVKETKAEVKETKAEVKETKAEVKETKTEPKETKAPKTEKKAPAKKAAVKKAEAPRTSEEEKKASYNAFELNTCIDMAKAMGIDMNYDDYAGLLMVYADPKEIEAEILKKYPVDASKLNYEEDGYDLSLLPVLIQRIGDGMDVKASSFKDLADSINKALKLELGEDGMANADVYNTLFDLVRQVLMLGQNRNYHDLKSMGEFIPADLEALIVKFMDTAYAVLPAWQYKDVKYYKDFLYAVLNQFEDLHAPYDNRAMMDVADLLIKHGDYGLGDAEYNYVLRENDLKDQIYFRFANVYRNLDLNKAKAIANDALRIVDNRYDYYPRIIEILES